MKNYGKGFTNIIAIMAVILLSAFIRPAGTAWTIPGGTKANFTIDGLLGIDVNGTVQISQASIVFDPQNLSTASFNVVLNVHTLATGIGKRDRHLKTADFFDVEKYPSMSFKSTAVQKDGGNFKVIGTLRIKEVEKTIAIPFTFSQNGNRGLFKGNFNINRVNYGIGTGKENAMGTEVKIRLEIPVNKA